MSSRVLPSVRDLVTIVVTVLLTLSFTNMFRTADAGVAGPTTDVVFVATGENFPDALGAAAAAGALLAPVLLVTQNSVPAETAAELNRLSPDEIIIVGGTAVISDGVKDTLEGLAFAPTVTRLAGGNRYATAAALSEVMFPTSGFYPLAVHDGEPGTVFLSSEPMVLRSVTLTAPRDGVVIALSTATVNEPVQGTVAFCSITTLETIDGTANQHFQSGGSGDGSLETLAGSRAFTVSEGETLTVNLVCERDSGLGINTSVQNYRLTAIFFADI